MPAAKLFALLAVFFALLAAVAKWVPFPGFYVHDFAMGPTLVLLFCLVTSANFAILYYAGDRIFHVRWHRGLTLLHFCSFVCFGILLSLVFALSTIASNGGISGESMRWVIVPLLLGMFSLVTSLVVFGINMTLSVVQLVRARFARH